MFSRSLPGNLPGLRCLKQSAQRLLHHRCRLRQCARRLSAWQREVGAHHPGQGENQGWDSVDLDGYG